MRPPKPSSHCLAKSLIAVTLVASPAAAHNPEQAALAIAPSMAQAPEAKASSPFAQFAPAEELRDHRIEYSYWDETLGFLVIPMGPSVREGAPTVQPATGTRRIYGHKSRYRLEGNRMALSFVSDQIRADLTEYRADLERVGNALDLSRIPRNEQLAFWINLHNVAITEALAYAYPLSEPSEGEFGSNRAALDDAKLVTIKGVSLSPRDIRENIVFPNWQDPKVIYGFWRGEIGGPSIQRFAFTGSNVDAALSLAAEEFVNSLRGVEKFSGALQVSKIYEEAAPFYFDDFEALRGHLAEFAREEVKRVIAGTEETRYNRYETDLADLTRGNADPGLAQIGSLNNIPGAGINAFDLQGRYAGAENTRFRAITRLMEERQKKLLKAYRRGIRSGMVIYGDGQYSDGEAAPEVK